MRRASPRRELQGTQPVPAAAAAAAVLRALCDPRSPAQSAFKQPSSDGADSTARSPFSPHRRGEALLPGEGAEQTRARTRASSPVLVAYSHLPLVQLLSSF